MDFGALIERLGPTNVATGAVLIVGLLVLVVALRAITNAALALRARLFALGSGLALTTLGAGRPLGLDQRAVELFAAWLDTPLEQAAAIVAVVLAVSGLVSLVLLYFWIRAMMRLIKWAFIGACLLGTGLLGILCAEGIIALPVWLTQTSMLLAIAGGLVLLWGVVRMLRPAAPPPA